MRTDGPGPPPGEVVFLDHIALKRKGTDLGKHIPSGAGQDLEAVQESVAALPYADDPTVE